MFNKIKNNRGQLAYTVFTLILLCAVVFAMTWYTYEFSEKQSLENLSEETQRIAGSVTQQVLSDRANLFTMANFAAELYADGDDFHLMFDSYEAVGLVENIGILLPDHRFITKLGTLDVGKNISFAEEAAKGAYISGRVTDITNPQREVIRNAVPIVADGETVGILYGVIELETLARRYADDAERLDAELYILEGGNGNFLVDTKHGGLGNVTALASIPYKEDFDYHRMIAELSDGIAGYSAFQSQTTGEYIYVHYVPLGVGNWRLMLSKTEGVVFAGARATGQFIFMMFLAVVLIMLAHLLVTLSLARKKARVSVFASEIRKSLLELSLQMDSVRDALESIRIFAKSRSAFFVDSYGEDYNNILPSEAGKLLDGEERAYFIRELLHYVSRSKKEQGASVQTVKLTVNRRAEREMPEFCAFLKKHDIHSVHFASVVDTMNTISLIGVINPKNGMVDTLIQDIAACFSMAIYNKKHLTKTEAMALTDSLTGLANRMAYKQDMKAIYSQTEVPLACIYIDVNELHYFNNKYGHAAGDQMLIYIAEVLGSEFSGSRIYRMGGDEMLILIEDPVKDHIEKHLAEAKVQIEEMKYHVSVGIQYKEPDMGMEELINSAEKAMYEDKAAYYQGKGVEKVVSVSNRDIQSITTGIKEVDACLSILSARFRGVYSVSLKTDRAVQVLAPAAYFTLNNKHHFFSEIMKNYIHVNVKPDFHRILLSFLDYETLEKQLQSGHAPSVSYTRIDGEKMVMRIFAVFRPEGEGMDTVWTFEKEDI